MQFLPISPCNLLFFFSVLSRMTDQFHFPFWASTCSYFSLLPLKCYSTCYLRPSAVYINTSRYIFGAFLFFLKSDFNIPCIYCLSHCRRKQTKKKVQADINIYSSSKKRNILWNVVDFLSHCVRVIPKLLVSYRKIWKIQFSTVRKRNYSVLIQLWCSVWCNVTKTKAPFTKL